VSIKLLLGTAEQNKLNYILSYGPEQQFT